MTTDAAPGSTDRSAVEDERWYLNDEREFLLRSIADAEREHQAGDLAQADFEVLTTRDRHRLAEVEAALASMRPVGAAMADAGVLTDSSAEPTIAPTPAEVAPRFSRWRWMGIAAACALIVTGAVILVDHAVSPSLPGQAPSGSITLPRAQLIEEQLAAALSLNNQGKAVAALNLYNKVLTEDPSDPDALAASGWLEWNYGRAGDSATLMAAGRRAEDKAIRVAPAFYAGHLFLGLILLNQDNDAPGAVTQFNDFLADNPPAAQVKADASLLAAAYVEAGRAVPAALASGTTTTTSVP